MSDNKIYLCAISNIESGTCNEDCKFCTQSVKYKADIERYRRKEIEDIVNEAKKARANKAVGFCLVTAGTGLDDKRLDYVCRAADAVHKAVPDISLIACNGIASYEQLKELKKHGIENYNHNLETAREFYNEICTTHSWDDRYETCLNAKKAGLYLCTGGIFGLGETQENRISMLESIASLEPMSVPINFFHPNDALPLVKNPLTKKEAFDLVKLARSYLPNQMLMIAGGRELMFGEEQYDVFKHGANALVVGDYLTTGGRDAQDDIDAVTALGYEIAFACHQ
ncbi:biotin synthase [Aliarcobacter butzleri]|uniref:biotin synthase n=1 Tax=Aliarcobacter butzleri TaxID=28197 RepID=UPI00189F7B20|nr:biotin synthase [Aliarcobacter butzleri]MBF7066211.1 biotin synthase [Aliarcobacter butzleri]